MMNDARAFAALILPLQPIDDCSSWCRGGRARADVRPRSAAPTLGTGAACINSRLVNTCFLRALLA